MEDLLNLQMLLADAQVELGEALFVIGTRHLLPMTALVAAQPAGSTFRLGAAVCLGVPLPRAGERVGVRGRARDGADHARAPAGAASLRASSQGPGKRPFRPWIENGRSWFH
jgi:hypothetical protein